MRFNVNVVEADGKAVVQLPDLPSYVGVLHSLGDLPLLIGGESLYVDTVDASCDASFCDFPSGADEFYGFDSRMECLEL